MRAIIFLLLLSTNLLARLLSPSLGQGYWVSSNVEKSEDFLTPDEACSWYLDILGYDLIAVEYYMEKGVNCRGYIRDTSRPLVKEGIIGNAGYIGEFWDRKKYDESQTPFCIHAVNRDLLVKNLSDLYGEQVQDWTIGAKTTALYAELLKQAQIGCEGLSLIPGPLTLPQTQFRSVLLYLLKYTYGIWQRQHALAQDSPMRICLLAAALSRKTDFALAQTEEVPLSLCKEPLKKWSHR